jgi:hypothetical protein
MSDEKPKGGRGPTFESPVRVTADGTEALTIATKAASDGASKFLDVVVMPPAQALAEMTVTVLDAIRGPFQWMRARTLRAIAEETAKLREAQGITEPLALPPKAAQVVMEQGSFAEDDKIRSLWAQLIVNAQAGMQLDAYLFELLGKLSSEDLQILEGAAHGGRYLPPTTSGIERLESLGLIKEDFGVSIEINDAEDAVGELDFEGYRVSDIAVLLREASTKPVAQILEDRRKEEAERRERREAAKRRHEEVRAEQERRMQEVLAQRPPPGGGVARLLEQLERNRKK